MGDNENLELESNFPITKPAEHGQKRLHTQLFQAATRAARVEQPPEAALHPTFRCLLPKTDIPQLEPQK